MEISASNTDPITHAVVLQGRYTVNVNIPALSARYRFWQVFLPPTDDWVPNRGDRKVQSPMPA
jgi:hypothetical protein